MAADDRLGLSDRDRTLWAAVARSVSPLGQRGGTAPLADLPAQAPSARVRTPATPGVAPQLDGGWERRLAKGLVEPDRTLDLHGLRLDAAWDRLDRAIGDLVAIGGRILLVIAGRDRGAHVRTEPGARGRIRAKLPDWLAASPHADRVLAVRPAHQRHGGAGAVYVVLRRSTR